MTVREHRDYSVEVLIARRDDGSAERARALGIVRAYWFANFPAWPLTVIDEGLDERLLPFNKARLINRAAEASSADVLLLADADSVAAPAQALAAVSTARARPVLVYGYSHYLMLSEQTTDTVASWRDAIVAPAAEEHLNMASTGLAAIRRESFYEVEGMDEGFAGWGYEDLAFALMCQVGLGPIERIPGDLVHLWHPRPPVGSGNMERYEALQQALRAAFQVEPR